MNFDEILRWSTIFIKHRPIASETTCAKVCKLCLMPYAYFSEHIRPIAEQRAKKYVNYTWRHISIFWNMPEQYR